ncbi:MAG: 3-deoxy-D-manno-octulosonic acid transferase [Candidatus Omnitrophota bacterium]
MRLGIFPKALLKKLNGQKIIWLHTVSVGEAQAVVSLAQVLKRNFPGVRLVISTVTKTGNNIAQKIAQVDDAVIYFPLDLTWAINRAIAQIRPGLVLLAETELWPRFISNVSRKNIPIVVVNGRISPGSLQGYLLVRPFLKRVLERISLFCMQSAEDAQRIIHLGAPATKVKVTGNMKFDLQLLALEFKRAELGLSEQEKLLLGGSTHRGEELILLDTYKNLLKSQPGMRLAIAPRHIERTAEIQRLVEKSGFSALRFSRLKDNEPAAGKQILIVDTIGQLKGLYALADIVFIGGSLVTHGGQNPIEPALFSRPILFGPYMFNFANIAELFLSKKAAVMIKDGRQLSAMCQRLLNEPQLAEALGRKARGLVEENSGATVRTMELIKSFAP